MFKSLHEAITYRGDHDRPLFSRGERLLSRADLRALCEKLMGVLEQSPARRIALCIDDTFCFTAALCACLYTKKVPVLPGHNLEGELKAQLESAERFDLMITDGDYKSIDERLLINCREPDNTSLKKSAIPQEAPSPDSVIIMYTSGSTGKSKLIRKSLRSMELEAMLLKQHFKDRTEGAFLKGTVYPWHLYGLTFRIFMPLLLDIHSDALITHYTEELSACAASKIILITSPAFVRRMDFSLKAPDIAVAVSAGGKMPAAAAASFYAWSGCAFDEIYGSTESGVMARRSFDGATDSRWRCFEGVSFEKRDGDIYLKSVLTEGQSLKIDDVLEFDESGCFKIIGRLGRSIKIEEKRISLREVEEKLLALEGISECAVVPLEVNGGLRIGAVLVVDEHLSKRVSEQGSVAFKKWLRASLAGVLDSVAIPRFIRIVPGLPENHMGKVQADALRELFR